MVYRGEKFLVGLIVGLMNLLLMDDIHGGMIWLKKCLMNERVDKDKGKT